MGVSDPLTRENEDEIILDPAFPCELCGFANVRLIDLGLSSNRPAAKCTNCGAGYLGTDDSQDDDRLRTDGGASADGGEQVGPIIFANSVARQQLVNVGDVVTFRAGTRTTGQTWWRDSRTGPKRGEVVVRWLKDVVPHGTGLSLEPYLGLSGFDAVPQWQHAIRAENLGMPQAGELYRVTARDWACDFCGETWNYPEDFDPAPLACPWCGGDDISPIHLTDSETVDQGPDQLRTDGGEPSRLDRDHDALTVECPTCGVPAGEQCVEMGRHGAAGGYIRSPHQDRARDASAAFPTDDGLRTDGGVR